MKNHKHVLFPLVPFFIILSLVNCRSLNSAENVKEDKTEQISEQKHIDPFEFRFSNRGFRIKSFTYKAYNHEGITLSDCMEEFIYKDNLLINYVISFSDSKELSCEYEYDIDNCIFTEKRSSEEVSGYTYKYDYSYGPDNISRTAFKNGEIDYEMCMSLAADRYFIMFEEMINDSYHKLEDMDINDHAAYPNYLHFGLHEYDYLNNRILITYHSLFDETYCDYVISDKIEKLDFESGFIITEYSENGKLIKTRYFSNENTLTGYGIYEYSDDNNLKTFRLYDEKDALLEEIEIDWETGVSNLDLLVW